MSNERPNRNSEDWTVGQEMHVVQRDIHWTKVRLKLIRGLPEDELAIFAGKQMYLSQARAAYHARNHVLEALDPAMPLLDAEAVSLVSSE